jgi:hypothetical protein
MTGNDEPAAASLGEFPLASLAFGVRYQPLFSIRDRLGGITDAILRASGTPFNSDFFPMSSGGSYEHLLTDPTGSSLRINQQDCILELQLGADDDLDRFAAWAEAFQEFVLRPLDEIGRVGGVVRYGALLKLGDLGARLSTSPAGYLLPREEHIHDFQLRFVKRMGLDEALARKDVNDRLNAIYTVTQNSEGEVHLQIDYQRVFDPPLPASEWRRKPFPRFVERAIAYYTGSFQDWLAPMLQQAVA